MAVVFLVAETPGSRWITGETIVVDGGERLYRGEAIMDEETVRGMRSKL